MSEWLSATLGQVARFTNGFAFGPAHWGTEGLPIIRIEQMLDPEADADRFDGPMPDRVRLDTGDLLMSWSGTIDVVKWSRGPALVNQRLFKVEPLGDIDPAFLFHLLKASLRPLVASSHGTTMKHIKRSDLLSFHVDLPPRPEQRRIAEVLDAVGDTIEATRLSVEKLQVERDGLAAQLIDCGLGTLKSGPASPPAHWVRGRLGDFIHLQRGFDITRATQRRGAVPVVSSGGVLSFHDTAMVDGPGVVIGRKGKLGDVYYVEDSYWPHDTTLWVTDFGGNLPRYVAEMLRRLRLERLDAATSVPTLNRNSVHPLSVAVPPPDEQQRVVDVLESVDSRIRAEVGQLAKLRRLGVGIAEDLLTGRVRAAAA